MVGNILKQLRLNRDLNQTEIAKELELSRERYNQYENERRAPDYETLKKIADYFNVSTDYLLGRTDDPAPIPTTTPTDAPDLETKWNNFLAQLPEDQAMHYQGMEYSDEENIAIMEEAEKAKQKKLKKIEKFLEYPIEVIDDALIYAAFDAEQRKKMNDEN